MFVGTSNDFCPQSWRNGNQVALLNFGARSRRCLGLSCWIFITSLSMIVAGGNAYITSCGHGAFSASISVASLSGQGEPYLLSRWLNLFANKSKVGVPHFEFWQIQRKVSGDTCHSVFKICPCLEAMSATTFKEPGMYVAEIWISYKAQRQNMSAAVCVIEAERVPPCFDMYATAVRLSSQNCTAFPLK